MRILLIFFAFLLLKTDNISQSFEDIKKVLKCYKCDSLMNECTEDIPGEVVDCPASIGCAITYEEEEGKVTMARDCSPFTDEEHMRCDTEHVTDGDNVTVRYCNCKSDLCNKDWEAAGSTEHQDTTTSAADPASILCYGCDSSQSGEDECDLDHFGIRTKCPASSGCRISLEVSMGPTWVRDCSPEEYVCCDEVTNDDVHTQFCNCNTPLCNENWITAGWITTTGQETTTTQQGPSLKCYSCTSEGGNTCDMSNVGELIECPGESVCMISVFSENGKDDLFKRTCASHDHGMEVKCGTTETDTTSLKFCNCDQDGCNRDWVTAGSTTTTLSSTTSVSSEGSKVMRFDISVVFICVLTIRLCFIPIPRI